MSEREISEQGFCPDCKSPSRAGHTPNCSKNNPNSLIHHPSGQKGVYIRRGDKDYWDKTMHEQNNKDTLRAFYKDSGRINRDSSKIGEWVKDTEENRLNFEDAQKNAEDVRERAEKRAGKRKPEERVIGSRGAYIKPAENKTTNFDYVMAHSDIEAEKFDKELALEKAREKLKNIK